MDKMNSVNAEQAEVVGQPTEVSETSEQTTVDEQSSPESAVAKQAQKQSREDNAAYAAIRRRAEAAEAEQNRLKAEAERLSRLVADQYGYSGSAAEVADQLEAATMGVDVSLIRQKREAEEAVLEENARLKAQLEQMQPLAVEHFKSDMLNRIKSVYTDVTADSVDEFGDEFAALIGADVDPVTAYATIKVREQAETKSAPPTIGKVNTTGKVESEYFTKEEVKKMTPAQKKANHDKIRASMGRW